MSLRLTTFLLVTVLTISTEAALRGRTLLHDEYCDDACHAAEDNHPDEIRHIIDEPHEICDCQCNKNGWTPLLMAAKHGCPGCVDHILAEPSNCSTGVTNKGGNTPLHVAAKNCQTEVVEKLLAAGADVNAKNSAGATPCASSSCEAVTALLQAANANGC